MAAALRLVSHTEENASPDLAAHPLRPKLLRVVESPACTRSGERRSVNAIAAELLDLVMRDRGVSNRALAQWMCAHEKDVRRLRLGYSPISDEKLDSMGTIGTEVRRRMAEVWK